MVVQKFKLVSALFGTGLKKLRRQPPGGEQAEMSLMEHIFELRTHLLRIVKWYALFVIIAFVGWDYIYHFLTAPYVDYQVENGGTTKLMAIGLMEVFIMNFKVCLTLGFAATLPFIVLEVWRFVSPALSPEEKKIAIPVMLASILMFYAGITFGFFNIVPAFVASSMSWASAYAEVQLTVENYFDFLTTMVLIFGVVFEVPVILTLLGAAGLIDSQMIAKNRKYVFLLCFVVGAILSPPDIMSQAFVSLPLYLMCEVSILTLRVLEKRRKIAESRSESQSPD